MLGLLVILTVAAGVSIKAMVTNRPARNSVVSYTPQVVLPFTHLGQPWGAAVDRVGNLYLADHSSRQLMKLAAGATAPTPLPSDGLSDPTGGQGICAICASRRQGVAGVDRQWR
ncbi:hypothetical protein ACGFK1_26090 [Mycobacterium sp. NPDC048908]|uniref:hypothetical protein n=1 Tax=Mycobacterium sp. NPDC048908 TaxID=3364292 RepID=UPI00371D501A